MPTRIRRRWSLLIVVLAFGIALMHTLGHSAADRSGEMPMAVAAAGHAVHPVDGLFASAMADTWAAGTELAARAPVAPQDGMDPSMVCLAVLTSLLLVVAAAWHRRSGRSTSATTGHGAPRQPTWRAPPPRPTGQSLAALSVLRI